MEQDDVNELKTLILLLQKELQDFRKENQEIQADLKILKKVFAYKVKQVTNKEIVEGRVNEWMMKILAKSKH